jgi:beta-galactosidase
VYHLGDVPGAQYQNYDCSTWETVCVPHTLKLTSLALDKCEDDKTQATFHRDIAWYRRTIEVSKNPGKVFLEFEGAHQVTDAWVNGRHVGQHAIGGYTPFHFDITEHVSAGKNTVALRLDNRRRDDTPPDPGPFDYIKFSGLYRDVYLVETAPLYVTFPWEDFYAGVFVTTPTVDPLNGNATVSVRTTVRNEYAQQRAS